MPRACDCLQALQAMILWLSLVPVDLGSMIVFRPKRHLFYDCIQPQQIRVLSLTSGPMCFVCVMPSHPGCLNSVTVSIPNTLVLWSGITYHVSVMPSCQTLWYLQAQQAFRKNRLCFFAFKTNRFLFCYAFRSNRPHSLISFEPSSS